MIRTTSGFSIRQIALVLGTLSFLILPSGAVAEQGSVSVPASQWVRMTSGNIELYTSSAPSDAARVLDSLNKAEDFFSQASGLRFSPSGLLRVVAFGSPTEYAPFRLTSNSFAHYLHGHGRDYIVLQDIHPEHLRATLHEYTHYALKQSGFSLPIWLNEGLAEYFSSMDFHGPQVRIGAILPERLATLREQSWIDLNALFSAGHDSPFLSDPDRVGVFYAQSWALAHMLLRDPQYSAHSWEWIRAIGAGTSSAEAFSAIYGRQIQEVSADLARYVATTMSSVPPVSVAVNPHTSFVQSVSISATEKTMVLAGLLAAHPRTASAARIVLSSLSPDINPTAELEQIYGILDLYDNRPEDSYRHLASAVRLGSQDPQTLYRCAELESKLHVANTQTLPLLSEYLRLHPDNEEARFNLGVLQFNRAQYTDAQATLTALNAVKTEWRYPLYSMLAFCAARDQNSNAAQSFLELAAASSRTSTEKSGAERLRAYVDSALRSVAMLR